MERIKINNSNYSFKIEDSGKVRLYRHDKDVTSELNYNIVLDMAYMLSDLLEEREKQNMEDTPNHEDNR